MLAFLHGCSLLNFTVIFHRNKYTPCEVNISENTKGEIPSLGYLPSYDINHESS